MSQSQGVYKIGSLHCTVVLSACHTIILDSFWADKYKLPRNQLALCREGWSHYVSMFRKVCLLWNLGKSRSNKEKWKCNGSLLSIWMNYVWDFVTLHDLNSKLTVSNGLRKFYDCSWWNLDQTESVETNVCGGQRRSNCSAR